MSTWPVRLIDGPVELRPLRLRDGRAWREVRNRNADWLKPWEATLPPDALEAHESVPTFSGMVRRLNREARWGRTLPWALAYQGSLIGQVTVGGIALGSLRGAYIGYWLDGALAGRGIMPTAVAMATDYCFDELRLHRIEINIRPENSASRRVVEKLGFRYEGVRPSYLHIDGAWRDHDSFALINGEVPGGVLNRWRMSHQQLS